MASIKRTLIIMCITVVMLFLSIGGAHCGSLSNTLYQHLYQKMLNDGYKDGEFEIQIDDFGDAQIIIYGTPRPSNNNTPEPTPAPEKAEPDPTQAPQAEVKSSEEEYILGLEEKKQGNAVEAMRHFLRALPHADAEKEIAELAYDYVDELMWSEEYQEAQTFMIDHPFDGCEKLLAECNDHCFLIDLAKALSSRWTISGKDTSTYSDKKIREWYQELVDREMEHLQKYTKLGFSDATLANYAYTYIGALQTQMTGATYYGKDNEKYNEYWFDNGKYVRSRMIYLINKYYGIEMEAKDQSTLKSTIAEGKNKDYIYAVTECITNQLSEAELSFSRDGSYIILKPFLLKNTSGYAIDSLTVDAVLWNNGNAVKRLSQLFNYEDSTRDGEDFVFSDSVGFTVFEHFDSLSFEFRFDDIYSDWCYGSVNPRTQYAWDGRDITANGLSNSDSQAVIALEEAKAYWEKRSTSIAPCVELTLRNIGDADIEEAVINCVFINKETNTVWNEEEYYAVSSQTTPLQPGRGKNVIVYSYTTLDKKTRDVPDLSVEIYINKKPLKTLDVENP